MTGKSRRGKVGVRVRQAGRRATRFVKRHKGAIETGAKIVGVALL